VIQSQAGKLIASIGLVAAVWALAVSRWIAKGRRTGSWNPRVPRCICRFQVQCELETRRTITGNPGTLRLIRTKWVLHTAFAFAAGGLRWRRKRPSRRGLPLRAMRSMSLTSLAPPLRRSSTILRLWKASIERAPKRFHAEVLVQVRIADPSTALASVPRHQNMHRRKGVSYNSGPLQGWIMARRAAILFIRLACEAIKVSKLQADGGPSRS
jgi:hypothetical protein